MGEERTGQWYWCANHSRVEQWPHVCAAHQRLGPYPTEEAARRWRENAEARNEAWKEADEDWEAWPGDKPDQDDA